MVMQSSAQLKGLEKTCEFQVGVGAIPKDTTLSYPAGGSNLLMFKGHTEEEEAAGWEFLKFMTDTENALKWANGTGYLPTRQSCMESDTFKKMIEEDPNLQIIVTRFSTAHIRHPLSHSIRRQRRYLQTRFRNVSWKIIIHRSRQWRV